MLPPVWRHQRRGAPGQRDERIHADVERLQKPGTLGLNERASEIVVIGERDAVHEKVQPAVAFGDGLEHCVEFGFVGDVALHDQRIGERGGELSDVLLEPRALVGEREPGAGGGGRAGDSPRNRTFVGDSDHEPDCVGQDWRAHARRASARALAAAMASSGVLAGAITAGASESMTVPSTRIAIHVPVRVAVALPLPPWPENRNARLPRVWRWCIVNSGMGRGGGCSFSVRGSVARINCRCVIHVPDSASSTGPVGSPCAGRRRRRQLARSCPARGSHRIFGGRQIRGCRRAARHVGEHLVVQCPRCRACAAGGAHGRLCRGAPHRTRCTGFDE